MCEHVHAILNAFNNVNRGQKAVAYIDCQKVLIKFEEEPKPEGMQKCLR